nr:MAG TPA: hypothetical protein [Caudoviricetes sp.]
MSHGILLYKYIAYGIWLRLRLRLRYMSGFDLENHRDNPLDSPKHFMRRRQK